MAIKSDKLRDELSAILAGEISDSSKSLVRYSHDASLFEIIPRLIVYPKNLNDVKNLIKFVNVHKALEPSLSITARSGGTDMSGGSINDSIIISFDRYFTHISAIKDDHISAQSGVYYRDLEKNTLKHNLILPSFPASREICMVGGMTANNAGGEKSLTYGKTINYVSQIKMVLRDGNEYIFKPLNQVQLDKKLKLKNLEGEIYRHIYKLIKNNHEVIERARPHVSKNSTGYNIWDVWNKQTFDLTKLIVGSQGTLGLITETEFQLVPSKPLSGLLIAYMPTLDHLGKTINTVNKTNPSSFEAFDNHTLWFTIRFFPYFRKTLGWRKFLTLAIDLIPDAWRIIRGIPKMILLIEFEGNDQNDINQKIDNLKQNLEPFGFKLEEAITARKSRKFWTIRRESFNLLRHNVRGAHTAPFIDDFVVPPIHLPEFLPKLQLILEKYDLLYTIAGHMGDGNFHIIPLMKLQNQVERDKIEPVMRAVNQLVLSYHGSLSGEHNDGLVRGPFLDQMYSARMMDVFRSVKIIFDPDNIFNPHKKTDANWTYSKAHIRERF